MQTICRVHLANCGYRSAWYEKVTLNMTDPSTGAATDTLLNLENGGGKTTLLSLFFCCFETAQDRFLKHVQNGNNSFAQYFTHDGVPGFIVIEWLMPGRSAGAAPYKLITGQAVCVRDTTSPPDVDRMFFSFEERSDLRLEDIPAPGLGQPTVGNMAELSRWLHEQQKRHSGNLFICHDKQGEWQRHLRDERHIDLDMLRMQVNFSADEGGFDKGFLDFKSEGEFLRKFLRLTSDAAKADEARKLVVSVCELHRRKPQLQRRRDELQKFRISLNAFADAARKYMDALAEQQAMLIQGAQFSQALQARAVEFRQTQRAELAFETDQRALAATASVDAAAYAKDWVTADWVLRQKRVALAKTEKESAAALVKNLERRDRQLRAARVQQEIVTLDARFKEADALMEAEKANLKPARDHVEIQGALLRRALTIEEDRLGDELQQLAARAKSREELKRDLRAQRTTAESDERKLTTEQATLNSRETQRQAKRRTLEQGGVFESSDEEALDAAERLEGVAASHASTAVLERTARDVSRRQATLNRTDAGKELANVAKLTAHAAVHQTFITRGQSEVDRLSQLPSLINAAEADRVDPHSPALPPRLQEVLSDSARQRGLADVRLAELRATRQAIADTGVAGVSADVNLVAQALLTAGVRSARPFNEYIAHAIKDEDEALALVASDPARFSGVCVAESDFPRAAKVSWNDRRPNRPVTISMATLTPATTDEMRRVVPPEDASAFNVGAAQRLAVSLDTKLTDEAERRDAYQLRYDSALKALQELETFTSIYGDGKLAEAEVKRLTAEEDAAAAQARAEGLEAEATELDEKAAAHDRKAAEAEQARSDAQASGRSARDFYAEHEVGRDVRLARIADLVDDIIDAAERKAAADEQLLAVESEQNADQTKAAMATVERKRHSEDRDRIELFDPGYPAQEQLQQHPRPLATLVKLYDDALSIYRTAEKDRLGSLGERIASLNEQRAAKKTEYSRDFFDIKPDEIESLLNVHHQEELAENEVALSSAKESSTTASTAYQTLFNETRTWQNRNKDNFNSSNLEHEQRSVEQLEALVPELATTVDAANGRMVAANREADVARSRADKSFSAAQADETSDDLMRSAMGLPETPDPVLIAAQIGALVGTTPDVAGLPAVVLEVNAAKQVAALLAQYKSKDKGVDGLTKEARASFDAVKMSASTASFRDVDPDVANQMSQNDFNAACTDASRLLEHLDDRISTTNSTLETMQADFDTCVEEILGVARTAIATLNRASSKTMCVPATAPYVGGKQVMKMTANFPAITLEMRRAAMRSYLDTLADTQVIPAKGTDLIADAVMRIYGKPLGIHVLKMSVEETEHYVPVEKISNSGGEGVVMAMFLYLVINQLRAENHAQVHRNAGGPLILDNPFAKATTPALWRAQRLLAAAMNVQLIFATAIQDYNAIGEFQRFIRLRKVGQNSKTKRWHIEVANLQLAEATD